MTRGKPGTPRKKIGNPRPCSSSSSSGGGGGAGRCRRKRRGRSRGLRRGGLGSSRGGGSPGAAESQGRRTPSAGEPVAARLVPTGCWVGAPVRPSPNTVLIRDGIASPTGRSRSPVLSHPRLQLCRVVPGVPPVVSPPVAPESRTSRRRRKRRTETQAIVLWPPRPFDQDVARSPQIRLLEQTTRSDFRSRNRSVSPT